jgi:small nuclear ribonucleoprotein E
MYVYMYFMYVFVYNLINSAKHFILYAVLVFFFEEFFIQAKEVDIGYFFSDLNMAARGPQTKVQKVMVQPINLIFRYLQNRSRIQVWLYEQTTTRIEGYIIGFDEYMNLVLDDAEEILLKKDQRKKIGRILLKGDNISLIQQIQSK